jgi:hypothetical protein
MVSYRTAVKVKYDFISMKFLIDRIPSCHILNFWDFGRIMAVGPCSEKLKMVILEIFTIILKFLNDRVPSYLILEIWDFGRIRE